MFIMGVSIICPRCHSRMTMQALSFEGCEGRNGIPYNLLYTDYKNGDVQDIKQFLYRCGNEECNSLLISECINSENRQQFIFPNYPKNFDFSTYLKIKEVSPSFVRFYNEAYKVEQLGYKNIAGPGYRKAIEFLIKDFIIYSKLDEEEKVKKMTISSCIRQFIGDKKISDLSKRAFWLGNDQTHYYQIRKDKDLDDLKSITKLLLHYIENTLEYNEIINEMGE